MPESLIICDATLRNPFTVESLPFLSRVQIAAFRHRKRTSKRFVGKPAKRLFRLLLALGVRGKGRLRFAGPDGSCDVEFNARNTQFGALFMPQNLPVYEPETSCLLDRLVGDSDVFFDIGANWGWYSALIASRPSFRGGVHAFEPFPSTFDDLVSVVKQTGLEARITCHDLALADRDGQSGMTVFDGVQSGLAKLDTSHGVQVRLARLDDLPIPPPDVIKIDAEDHEYEVLKGAEGVIEKALPFIIFENWLHRDRPSLTLDPLRLLADKGYVFFFPGWSGDETGVITASPQGSTRLALAPLPMELRFLLPDQINIVAVHRDKMDAFRQRLS